MEYKSYFILSNVDVSQINCLIGAKFGGYGSFLPSYQRSPSIWSHPRTPQKVQTYSTPKSPNNLPEEVLFVIYFIPLNFLKKKSKCDKNAQSGGGKP